MEPAGSVEPAGSEEESGFAASLDPTDVIRGLAHMDMLIERVALHRAERWTHIYSMPRNAVERHWQTNGHQLRFGCCRPDDEHEGEAA